MLWVGMMDYGQEDLRMKADIRTRQTTDRDRPSRLQHYLRYRQYYEAALVLLVMAINSGIAIVRQRIDIDRLHLSFEPWEPFAWSYTSDFVTLLLFPCIILLCRRFP